MKSKPIVRLLLLVAVVIAFVVYFLLNKDQFSRVGNLTFIEIVLIVIGQSMVIIGNIFVLSILVLLAKKRIPLLQSARVTAYSSVINFFGFLQGGVGFRGLYLKKNVGISLKNYTGLTIVQYLVFFGVAGALVLAGLGTSARLDPLTYAVFGSIALLAVAGIAILRAFKPERMAAVRDQIKTVAGLLQAKLVLGLIIASLFQLSGSLLAGFVELNAIGAAVTASGLLIYTGVSQFAIIIAVTPGAIGVREGLLLIVQNQMGLSTQDIVLAATIDRALYFVTLAIFVPLALGAKRTLVSKSTS